MKFTILSHAGLLVEHNGIRLVVDPWLTGSCYWRSWWNFPEPPADLVSNLRADFIYLTHLHWDHFHGVSLRKFFPSSTRILVPKLQGLRMLRDLAHAGFLNVTEVAHGGVMNLGADFRLYSYQFNLLGADSAIILQAGNTTLFDCNDCKFFGAPLRQITKRFPRIDFVLRSHSNASPIPYCVEGYRELLPTFRSKEQYSEEFARFALHIGARFAIPFASNHCFLHQETLGFNETAVLPDMVQKDFARISSAERVSSTCVIMAPGSSWDEVEGFRIAPFDYSKSAEYIAARRAERFAILQSQYAVESDAAVDREGADNYFRSLMLSVPWPIRRALGWRLLIRSTDAKSVHCWLLDLSSATVEYSDDPVLPAIELSPYVLNDCVRWKMFSAWPASKRLRIKLNERRQLLIIASFFVLLDLYELEVIPISNNLTRRALSNYAKRWREFGAMAALAFRLLTVRRRFVLAELYSNTSNTNSWG